jgi:transcriptional regulator with XRE-family HTH domain
MDATPLRRTIDRLKLESLRRRKREHLEWVDRTRGVGYLISRARNHARLSQEQLAKEMHTTQSTVSRWECGHQLPSLLTLERVAIATDLQLEVAFQSRDGSGDFCCAAVLRDEGNMTELEILKNWSHENIEWPPVEDPPRRVDTFKGRPSGDGW